MLPANGALRLSLLIGLASALALAACSSSTGKPPAGGNGGTPGFGGSGGSGGSHSECDLDGDGHDAPSCGGDDCNDRNPSVYPGAPELCTGGLDENCNGQIDEGCECSSGDVRKCYPLGPPTPPGTWAPARTATRPATPTATAGATAWGR